MGIQTTISLRRVAFAAAVSSIAIISATTNVAAQAPQSLAETRGINIPAGPLAQSITSVSEQFDVPIVVPDALVAGKVGPSVSGQFTLEQALARVLDGSGLEAQVEDNGGVTIIEAETAGTDRGNRPRQLRLDQTVIVTGTKKNLSIQDTQTSVSVVTDEIINQRAIFELSDIFLRTANVTETNGPFSFSIRGISSGGVGGAGTGRTANVYLDNAPASLNGLSSAFNLWDIDQVEILRGPQSTTQGRNALAGAVVLQSADPEYEFGAKARALIGNDNTYQVSGMVTGAIIPDQLAFRVSADYREQDFESFNAVQMTPEGASDATTLRAKLLVEPNAIPDLRVELSAQYVDFFTSGDGSGVLLPPPGSPEEVGFDPFDLVNYDFRGGTVENENLRLLADVTYDLTDNWTSQIVATYDDTERFINNATGPDLRVEETYTVDVRAIFDYDRWTGWIGGYYFNEDLDSNTDQSFDVTQLGGTISPPGTPVVFQQTRSAQTENYAIYGDVSYDVSDKITLNFGARFDTEEVTDTGFASNLFADVAGGAPCLIDVPAFSLVGPCDLVFALSGLEGEDPQGDSTYEAFLPRGGVIFDIDDTKSISFMVQRGYRAGGLFVFTDADTNIQQIGTFDAEFLTNYEMAWRSTWLDDRLTLNANAFFSTWSDQQVRVQEPNSIEPLILNAGESELYGLELEANFDIAPFLSVYGSLGLVQTEFTEFPFAVDESGAPTNPSDPTFANLAGNEFGSAPNVTGSVGVSYDNETGIFGSAILSFRGDQYTDVTNLEINETDSYVIMNARLGYQTDYWKISAFVDNLFDEQFLRTNLLEAVDPETGTVVVPNIRRNNISQPRHFGVEIEAAF
ncbi:MAG: TonB-dependent receptor [Pseudomonadota bacterium]